MLKDLFGKQTGYLQQPAFIEGANSVSREKFVKKTTAVQSCLPKGGWSHAAIFLPDGSDFAAALFGILLLGKTAFPMNSHLTPGEIIPLLKRADADIVVTSRRFGSIFDEISAALPRLKVIYSENCKVKESSSLVYVPFADSSSPMLLLSTSGSTGNSKLVPLTEKNIQTSVYGYLDRMSYENTAGIEVRYFIAAPLSSAYGLMVLFVCMLKGFTPVVLTEVFTPDAFYQAVQNHKVTHYEGGVLPLLMMKQTAGRPVPYDISLLKDFGFGGSKISGDMLRELLKSNPDIRFRQGYGMTEAAPLITKYPKTDLNKADSVGKAIKGVTLFIEADGKITRQPYVNGEILVKGYNVMSGYYKNEAETKKVLKNGCLYTGDLGYLDPEGYLYINGRKKNIIIVRGFNVYPEEVEDCILNNSLVKDCVVYGETDAEDNETVCADIIPADPASNSDDLLREITEHCKLNLSDFKQPRTIRFADSIKKTATGKPDRKREEPL